MKMKHTLSAALFCSALASTSHAATWSNTEVQLQHGDLTDIVSTEAVTTSTFTFQHASGWEYGSNFFFFDYDSSSEGDSVYGEWYPTFSSKSIFGLNYGGPIKDVGLVTGVNAAAAVNEVKYLPGVQVDWRVPGFNFFSTMVTAYMDDGRHDLFGDKEENSWMFDVAWQLPFNIGPAAFSFEGHAEYIAARDVTSGGVTVGERKSWILAQPQLRWDAGKTFFKTPNKLHLGLEYQYWQNKLGTDTNESHPRFLAVWQL